MAYLINIRIVDLTASYQIIGKLVALLGVSMLYYQVYPETY